MMKQDQTLFKARKLFENLILHLLNPHPEGGVSAQNRKAHLDRSTFDREAAAAVFIEAQGTGGVVSAMKHE